MWPVHEESVDHGRYDLTGLSTDWSALPARRGPCATTTDTSIGCSTNQARRLRTGMTPAERIPQYADPHGSAGSRVPRRDSHHSTRSGAMLEREVKTLSR